jgi:hypothetical protein
MPANQLMFSLTISIQRVLHFLSAAPDDMWFLSDLLGFSICSPVVRAFFALSCVPYTTFCSMQIRCQTFISVSVQVENLTGCPKCTGIKNIMTYACRSVTIYHMQSVLSNPVLSHAKLTLVEMHPSLAKQDVILNNFLVTEYISHGLLRALKPLKTEFLLNNM